MDPNDFWIGDNAWLLTALKQHRVVTGDQRYNGRITMLVNWFSCLENLTPAPGIYSGFRKDGSLMNWRHAEGSIDVYGALKGLNAEPVRLSVKAWLDDAVWPSDQHGCFDVGSHNRGNLPTDNVSWGALALGPDYRCLLQHAEARTARTQDRYLVETFDRFDTWKLDHRDDDQQHVDPRQPGAPTSWAGARAARALCLERPGCLVPFVSHPGHPIGRDARLPLLFLDQGRRQRQPPGGQAQQRVGRDLLVLPPLDFVNWRVVSVRYDQFEPFGPAGAPLGEIGKIEFAVNNASRTATAGNDLVCRSDLVSGPRRPDPLAGRWVRRV